MNKKTRKTIKYSLFALLFALFFASVTALLAVSFRARAEKPVPFSQKVVYSVKDQPQNNVSSEDAPNDVAVNVMLQYAEDFTCGHDQINSEEELEAHRNELKAFYMTRNADIVGDLDLSDCVSASYSHYGPYIEYRYDSAADFFGRDFAAIERADSVYLEKVYVEECDFSDDATRNSSRSNYDYLTALSDIGLDGKTYTGNGVKVGIVESGVPQSTVNLESGSYETYGTYLTAHSFQTSSIIGAKTGIATDARLYFAALTNYSFVDCCNWFIENGVSLINRSNGGATGTYNSASAYADYVVKEAKITFVNSAGNDGDSNTSGYPGTGVNVISVASTDWNGAISSYSSAGMQEGQTISLANPTLAAPGGSISGIPNVSGAISGTSFSAPMVTGVVALLMEEFPQLKLHPETVMAVLTNTCTPATGQTETWDHDAGFGIINYNRARAYMSNTHNGSFSGTANVGDQVNRYYVTVPAGATIKANLAILLNSRQKDQGTLLPVNYTKLSLAVMDNSTGKDVATGVTISNYSYVTFTNTSNYSASYSLVMRLATAKTTTETEFYSFNYALDDVNLTKLSVSIFHNGQHVYGNNFAGTTTLDTGLTFDMGDYITITQSSDLAISCNYALGTELTVSLVNGFSAGANRIVFSDSGRFEVTLIFYVNIKVDPPRLAVGGALYDNGKTLVSATNTYVGWSLESSNGIATARITSQNYNRTFNCKLSGGVTLTGADGATTTYTITLTDDYGITATFTLIIDKQAPDATVFAYSPTGSFWEIENNSKTNLPFAVRFDSADAKAVYTCDGGAKVNYYGARITVAGTYVFTISDAIGNSVTRTIYFDNLTPELNLRISVYGRTETAYTINSANAEIENYFLTGFTLGGLTDGDKTAVAEVTHGGAVTRFGVASLPVSFSESGQYSVRVYDSFGNGYSFNLFVLGDEPSVEFSVDGYLPSLRIKVLHDQPFEQIESIVISRNNIPLEGVSPDVREYEFYKDGYYSVTVIDNVGRVITVNDYRFFKEAPQYMSITGDVNDGRATRSIAVQYDSSKYSYILLLNGEQVITSEIGAINLNGEGKYEIKLFYTLDEDNYTTYTFEIDKTAPVLTASATLLNSNEVENFNTVDRLTEANRKAYESFAFTSFTDSAEFIVMEIAVNGEVRRYFGGSTLPVLTESGLYAISVYDDFGNGYSFTVRIAGKLPEISFNVNGDKTAFSVIIDYNGTYVYASSLEICRNNEPLEGVNVYNNYYTFSADGDYSVLLTDDAGRQTESSFSFQKEKPVANISGIPENNKPNGKPKTKDTVDFTYDKSVFYAVVYLNGELISSDYQAANSARSSDCSVGDDADYAEMGVIYFEEDGDYKIILLYISDPNNFVEYEFEIDKTAPQIILEGGADGETVRGKVNVAWLDDDVDIAVYVFNGETEQRFDNNSVFTADGLYTVTLTDDVGNLSQITFGIDNTAPEVNVRAWVYGEAEQRRFIVTQFNSSDTSGIFCTRFEISSVTDALGDYTVEVITGDKTITYNTGDTIPVFTKAGGYNVYVKDGLGNKYLFMFCIIGAAPQVSFNVAENFDSFNVNVVIEMFREFISNVSVFRNGEYVQSGDMTFAKDGEYTVIVQERFGRVVERTFEFVKPKPAGELKGAVNGERTNGTVAFSYSEAYFVQVRKDNEDFATDAGGELNFTADGAYTVKLVYKTDADSFSEYSFEIDNTAPAILLGGCEDGKTVSRNVRVAWQDSDVFSATYSVNGITRMFSNNSEFTADGVYTVTLEDDLGNVSQTTFGIDKTAPEVNVNAWVYGEDQHRNLNLNQNNYDDVRLLFCTRFEIARVTDAYGMFAVEVMHNGVRTRFEDGAEVPALTDAGVYDILATDGINNLYIFTVNVIGAAPEVSFNSSEDLTSFNVSVYAEAWSDLITAIEIYRDGKKLQNGDFNFVQDGEYTVKVSEYFGRVVESTFEFVKPKPEGELTGAADGGRTNGAVAFSYGETFYVTAQKDGEALALAPCGEITFTDDGEYVVTLVYKTDAASFREYRFVIDTVAPEMQISGVRNGGYSVNPVVIEAVEDGAVIEVYKDGEIVEYVAGEQIAEAGSYEVRVTDVAGNVSVYTFEINERSTLITTLVIISAIVAALAVCVTIAVTVIRETKKMRKG